MKKRSNMEKSEALIEKLCGHKPAGHWGLDVLQNAKMALLQERGYSRFHIKDCDWPYIPQNAAPDSRSSNCLQNRN